MQAPPQECDNIASLMSAADIKPMPICLLEGKFTMETIKLKI